MSLNKKLRNALILISGALFAQSCSEESPTIDVHHDWQQRNEVWLQQIADSAAADPEHWLKIKSYTKPQGTEGAIYDYIYVHKMPSIYDQYQSIYEGAGQDVGLLRAESAAKGTPQYSDSVFVSFRGKLLEIDDLAAAEDAPVKKVQEIFTTTYYGNYSPHTSSPVAMGIGGTVAGFSTALQNMNEGDHWLVYIPQQLGYGGAAKDVIPAYSTLQFDLILNKWYKAGSGMPSKWY